MEHQLNCNLFRGLKLGGGGTLGTVKPKKEDTEDKEGREAGNSPHFLRQDAVLL